LDRLESLPHTLLPQLIEKIHITPAVIKRDRSIVIAGLAAVIALATAYTVHMARQMVVSDPTIVLNG